MQQTLDLSFLDKYLSWSSNDFVQITKEDIDTILKCGNNIEVFSTNIHLIHNTKNHDVFKSAHGALLIFEISSTQDIQEIANCIETINDVMDLDATIISSFYISENKTPCLTSLITK